jgi:enediyne polyketide synthase
VERWQGLTLRAVRKRDGAGPWVPSLLGSYVERSTERVLGGSRAVVVEPDAVVEGTSTKDNRRERTRLAASRVFGREVTVHYRPDGRPEVEDAGGVTISASHGAGLTVVIAGDGRLACDVEVVEQRGAPDWADLLGAGQLPVRDAVVAETGESPDVSATRVWSAQECLRKIGVTTQALTVDRVDPDGWVVLSDGDARIATWVTTVNGQTDQVVFAVLSGEEN